MNDFWAFCCRNRKEAVLLGLVLMLAAGPMSWYNRSFRQEAVTVDGTIKEINVRHRVKRKGAGNRYKILVEYVDHRGQVQTKRFKGRWLDKRGETVEVEYRRPDPTSARLTRSGQDILPVQFLILGLVSLLAGTAGFWVARGQSRDAEAEDPT